MMRPLSILLLGVGLVIVLVHSLRVLRVQRGLAEFAEIRRSIMDGENSDGDLLDLMMEKNKIREEYRARGISHPHYEAAMAESPAYYGGGLVLMAIGAVMYWRSRKPGIDEPTTDSALRPPNENEAGSEG